MDLSTAPSYIYRATARRVIDGDTFIADVDVGFCVSVAVTVRVRAVNAPEHSRPGGKQATEYLNRTLAGRALLIQSYRDERSFARWICDVWVQQGAAAPALASLIIAAGHGIAYDPKTDHWTP